MEESYGGRPGGRLSRMTAVGHRSPHDAATRRLAVRAGWPPGGWCAVARQRV